MPRFQRFHQAQGMLRLGLGDAVRFMCRDWIVQALGVHERLQRRVRPLLRAQVVALCPFEQARDLGTGLGSSAKGGLQLLCPCVCTPLLYVLTRRAAQPGG